MKKMELPKIICGNIIYPREVTETIELKYQDNVVAVLPKITQDDVDIIVNNRERLHDIPMSIVTAYLSNSGANLLNHDDGLIQEAVEYSTLITGYHRKMFERDYFMMGDYTLNRNVLYDLLEAELGDHRIMDEWINNQVAKIRAYPRGRAFHILVGNVPLASMYSIIRSVLTKNQTIVKIPSRDPVTSLYYIMNLIKSNEANHIISRSISAIYIDKKSEYYAQLLRSSDMVCAWGKGSTLKDIKADIPHSIPYLELGPKRSLSILFNDSECNFDTAAVRMAHDLSIYDQEACFSPQRLFILGNYEDFIPHLKKYLDIQSEALPKGKNSIDAESYLSRVKMEAYYIGWEVIDNRELGWTIIKCQPHEVKDHPLSRTLFVHQIQDLSEILPYVDDESQAISIFPHGRHREVANMFCANGVQRICEVGQLCYPREGFTHDGMYPLNYFVRMSSIDASVKDVYKYGRKTDVFNYLRYVYGNPNIDNFHDVLFEDRVNW